MIQWPKGFVVSQRCQQVAGQNGSRRLSGHAQDKLHFIHERADVKGHDHPSETFRVLKEQEIRQHGEYRSRYPVLAAGDRIEASGEFTAMGV